MNQTTLDKIKAATPFLAWFHCQLSQEEQEVVRRYLDRPYQLALKIIDCCSQETPQTSEEIASSTNLSKATVRQVLKTLEAGGMTFIVSPINTTDRWQAKTTISSKLAENKQSFHQKAIASVGIEEAFFK
jgi:transcription initiation factor IIE alpha subunit